MMKKGTKVQPKLLARNGQNFADHTNTKGGYVSVSEGLCRHEVSKSADHTRSYRVPCGYTEFRAERGEEPQGRAGVRSRSTRRGRRRGGGAGPSPRPRRAHAPRLQSPHTARSAARAHRLRGAPRRRRWPGTGLCRRRRPGAATPGEAQGGGGGGAEDWRAARGGGAGGGGGGWRPGLGPRRRGLRRRGAPRAAVLEAAACPGRAPRTSGKGRADAPAVPGFRRATQANCGEGGGLLSARRRSAPDPASAPGRGPLRSSAGLVHPQRCCLSQPRRRGSLGHVQLFCDIMGCISPGSLVHGISQITVHTVKITRLEGFQFKLPHFSCTCTFDL
ncbi:uncharacterized protein ACBT57_004167 [Dama dama]